MAAGRHQGALVSISRSPRGRASQRDGRTDPSALPPPAGTQLRMPLTLRRRVQPGVPSCVQRGPPLRAPSSAGQRLTWRRETRQTTAPRARLNKPRQRGMANTIQHEASLKARAGYAHKHRGRRRMCTLVRMVGRFLQVPPATLTPVTVKVKT